jgi:hypothetical protein
MKKIISLVIILTLASTLFCSCGKTKERIDGKTFDFAYAQDSLHVLYCSSENSQKFPAAEILDYRMTAENGTLTITGKDESYTGSYTVKKVMKDYVLYNFVIDGEESIVSFGTKENPDGTVAYSIIWAVKGYTVNFVSLN